MARPQKEGLDYFALDVKMNDEVELIEAQYGLEGFAVLIKLFQKIYSKGYYLLWNEKEQILFSNKIDNDKDNIKNIVNDCIKWGIFNKTMFEKYNILTSKRIQNHYITAVYKRVNVEIEKEYLLIDISDKKNITYISISDVGNSETSYIPDVQSTQRKEKKRKEKESIEKKRKEDKKDPAGMPLDMDLKSLVNIYQNNIGMITPIIADDLKDILEEYKDIDLIDEAFKIAVRKKTRHINFIRGVLRNWKDDKIETIEDLKSRDIERGGSNGKDKARGSKQCSRGGEYGHIKIPGDRTSSSEDIEGEDLI